MIVTSITYTDMTENRNQKIINRIREEAKQNEGMISRRMAYDIISNDEASLSDEEIEKIFYQIEQSDIKVSDSDEEDYYGNSKSDNPPIPADLRMATKNPTVDLMVNRLKNGEIELYPDFQRHPDLWSVEQKSQLIESLILGIPLPSFYFDATNDEKWIVIDGLQRLSAIKGYIIDENYCLKDLEFLSDDALGKRFSELPRKYVRRIMETQLTAFLIEKGTPKRIIFNIFKRLNTGGLTLEPQEIRHALNQGSVLSLIREMAECTEFKEATGYSIKPKRMLDYEYATRYLAFTRLGVDKYEGNIDDFLDEAMEMGNKLSSNEHALIKEDFRHTMQVCKEIFGKYAFRRISVSHTRGPVNKAIFETMSLSISKYRDNDLNKLIRNRNYVVNAYFDFISKNALYFKAGDKYTVNKRVQLMNDFIGEMIDAVRD